MNGDLHPSVVALKALDCPLSEDHFDLIAKAMPFTDNLPPHPNAAEVEALLGVLPENGDTAAGLNWTILHCIEASPDWPIWTLLEDPNHEWQAILRTRLKNGGYVPPRKPLFKSLFGA